MGTAAQHVLALPELLSTILQHVHDDQPLLNCMLVNSLWEYESTTIQWTEVGELPLENVHPERQQYYADKVRKCSVPIVDVEDGANTTLSLVKHRSLVFPRLKSVKVIGNVSGWRLSVWRLPVICDASFDPLFPSTLQNIELELPTMDCFPPLLELIAVREVFCLCLF
ncbi:hypothetical protein BU16DRAFT_288469 [Lophium mytilinum]|uniref:Uncharacterized protein n=1 Tax=Lophium mytilinum TaxID=390894 RepID=A0A6A6R186_9PEZI|nr:hypothetical protein BU16DRAFT_288469 [Lophium mytilinum]